MQQEKIRFKSNQDQSIKFLLGNSHDSFGLESTINEIVDDSVRSNINPANDAEKMIFFSDKNYTLDFYFFNPEDKDFDNNYAQIFTNLDFGSGFTVTFFDEIIYSIDGSPRQTYSNSFYVLEIYDSTASENQNRIHISYIQLDPFDINYTYEENVIAFFVTRLVTGATTTITLNNDQEASQFYISNDYLENITGDTLNAYARISFYNAKIGKVLNLYNVSNSGSTVNEDLLYFDVTIDLVNNEYSFESDTLIAYQYISEKYQNVVNENIENIINKNPVYRDGNTFTVDGKYLET
ncbi:MAG: hypothetical protein ACOC33_00300 [bacterium]